MINFKNTDAATLCTTRFNSIASSDAGPKSSTVAPSLPAGFFVRQPCRSSDWVSFPQVSQLSANFGWKIGCGRPESRPDRPLLFWNVVVGCWSMMRNGQCAKGVDKKRPTTDKKNEQNNKHTVKRSRNGTKGGTFFFRFRFPANQVPESSRSVDRARLRVSLLQGGSFFFWS